VATIALLAGVASAQTAPLAASPAAPPADAVAASTPAAKSQSAGNTVSSITVTPTPKKVCAARDKDCVARVVAELKRLYPEQLKQFCFQEQTKAVRTQFTNDQLFDSLNGNGPPTPTAFPVSAALKTACATDKK
jgi:hypothetical protein